MLIAGLARIRVEALIASLCGAVACTGVIDGEAGGKMNGASPGAGMQGPGSGLGGTSSGPGSLSDPLDCSTRTIGTAPLLRLTRSQYAHSVRDFLDEPADPTADLPPDEKLGLFHNNATAPVASLDVEKYFDVADSLATAALARLATLAPCDRQALGDAACAETVIQALGRRVFRRPLAAEELDDFLVVYQENAGAGFDNGMRLALTAMLASPHFLYRLELTAAAPGALAALDGYELAGRLALFLWDSAPDDALLDAAGQGSLTSDAGLRAEAERLLADPRARDMVSGFHRQWLGIDGLPKASKDGALFPGFNADLGRSMQLDTERFAQSVVLDGDGLLSTLLTSPRAFPDANLAPLYGVSAAAADGSLPVTLDASQRAGLLTQPAFLAAHSHADQTSPVNRGKAVRVSLLCAPPPPPPPEVNVQVPDPDPSSSTRERFAEHTADASCAGCHALLDPIGFGFEHYDAIGAYRTSDGGQPVNASGEVSQTRDADGPFVGAIELSARLAQSDQVRECVARQWFEYALGRLASADDTCSLAQSYAAFQAQGFNVRELFLALIVSDAFRYRRGPP